MSAAPLTLAEFDLLSTLDAARTPGPLTVEIDGRHDVWIRMADTGAVVARLADADLGRIAAAALNALPALLAEVRASRAAPPPTLADALDAYGRAFCRAARTAHPRWEVALDAAEQALLAVIAGEVERAAAEGARIAAEAREESRRGSMMRCRGEGWIQATPLDAAGRRAVWMRWGEGDAVELCGGREGDDCYVRLVPGMVLDAQLISEIMDPLERTAFALESDREYTERQADALLTVPLRAVTPDPSDDTAPRQHIPADLLTRGAGGGLP